MKVLFVSAFSQDSLESGANRLRKLASGIERNGGKVSWIYPKSSGKIRACANLIRGANLWMMEHRDGVCLISLPPPWLVVPAFLLALFWRSRLWLDFRDPLLNQTINPRPLYFRVIMGFLQNVAVRKSGGCIHASSRIPEMLGIDGPKSEIVYAGVEPDELASIRKIPVVKSESKFQFVYGGTFYGSRSPVVLLDALEIVKKKAAHPHFVFYCSFNNADEEKRFKALVTEKNLNDFISFQPLLKRDKFLGALKNADCNLLITHGTGSEYAIPGKIYDYIMAERPILAISNDSELKDFAKRFSVNVQFADPGSANEVAEAILKLMLDSGGKTEVSADLMCDVQARKFLNQSFAPRKS